MGRRQYQHTTTVASGHDGEPGYVELEVTYGFSVAWGSPEVGRGYMADPALYCPGSASVVEDVRVLMIEGRPRPWGDPFNTDDELAARLIDRAEPFADEMLAVAEGEADAEDERALEYLAEARREDRMMEVGR